VGADGMSIDSQGNWYVSAGMNQLRGTARHQDQHLRHSPQGIRTRNHESGRRIRRSPLWIERGDVVGTSRHAGILNDRCLSVLQKVERAAIEHGGRPRRCDDVAD